MKILTQLSASISLMIALMTFSSCEQKVTLQSIVHEDGSVERVIILNEVDSSKLNANMFGISSGNGWVADIRTLEEPEKKNEEKNKVITFKKAFTSVDEMNKEMDDERSRSLFRINSELKKSFRWFYTYMDYSDTYRALNRFRHVTPTDYFTAEDYAFIDRLPAEGKPITKADSLYLQYLNEKIYDEFAFQAMFEEHYSLLLQAMQESGVEQRWLDSVAHKKLAFMGMVREQDDMPDDFILKMLDDHASHLPLANITTSYRTHVKDFDRRMNFMTDAVEGKYTHAIVLPWGITKSNADSVQGSTLLWNPPVVKFMLRDYTMRAEARKLNTWPVILSGFILLLTIYLFIRKKPAVVQE